MCTYLFNYHRDEYRWYVHDTYSKDAERPPPNVGEMSNYSVFEPYMYSPKPRVAIHARYHKLDRHNLDNDENVLNNVLKRGYCHSPPFPKVEEYCKAFPVCYFLL